MSTETAGGYEPSDIVIVTVIPEEFAAVCNVFGIKDIVHFSDEGPNLFSWRRGAVRHEPSGRDFRVVVGMAGRPTNPSSSIVINDAVDRFRPDYVLLVGIAGGFPKDGVVKGDVVVSTFIVGYQYGKLEREFNPRPHFSYPVDTGLLNAAQSVSALDPHWCMGIGKPPEGGTYPKCVPGLVASGDMVVDVADNAFFAQVLHHYPTVAAVEMEGAGAAMAIQYARDRRISVGFLMVRGISDMPRRDLTASQMQTAEQDGSTPTPQQESNLPLSLSVATGRSQGDERDSWKCYSANSAAHFAYHLIRKAWPVSPRIRTVGQQGSPVAHTSGGEADVNGGQGAVWELFAQLYPLGPLQENVWARAGGEVARLPLGVRDSARAQWFSAIELIFKGGGGTSLQRLVDTALSDHPDNQLVRALAARLTASQPSS